MKAQVNRRKRSNQTGKIKSEAYSAYMYRSQKEGAAVLRPTGNDFLVNWSCRSQPVVLQLVASEAAHLSLFNRRRIITALEVHSAMGRVLQITRLRPSGA